MTRKLVGTSLVALLALAGGVAHGQQSQPIPGEWGSNFYCPPAPPSQPDATSGALELEVSGRRVLLRKPGLEIEATADRISFSGKAGRLVLEGNVEVKTKDTRVAAPRVAIRLADGGMEIGAGPAQAGVPTPVVVPLITGESVPLSGLLGRTAN